MAGSHVAAATTLPTESLPGMVQPGSTDDALIAIFGASGDLSARKLVPALFSLWKDGFLSAKSSIVGVARRPKTDDEYRTEMHAAVSKFGRFGEISAEEWAKFAQKLFYRTVNLDQPDEYVGLAKSFEELEKATGLGERRVFYMATSPDLFVPTAEAIYKAGMVPDRRSRQILRMVFEKPFGHDLESAQHLQRKLGRILREEQIYRIDHYLGKETVQNILLFRFGNSIFEPLFNRNHIDHVQITVAESQGIEQGRGGYYDTSGAMRDVLQNHVLQLLALIAMEPPSFFRGKDIRDEKVKVLDALAPGSLTSIHEWAIRGQYGPATIGGKPAAGYRQEDRVNPNSNTETYAALEARIDNWRWAGVPFYLRTGKRMPARVSEITIQFKSPPLHLFKTVECDGDMCELVDSRPNMLIFRIQPSEAISLQFSTKRPGMQYQIHPARMDFAYEDVFTSSLPEAYERLLLDVTRGDSTLFMRNDELEAAWRFCTPVLNAWANDPKGPELYEAGTWGPAGADAMLARTGRRWYAPKLNSGKK
jgi:glucose-6-phosphate 1-dehydrogenase